jgi:uncharacterized protein
MKQAPPRRLRSLLACALVAAALQAPAAAAEEPRHPAKPLLWKIEGQRLTKPSYLFATLHLGGAPLTELHPAAARAFDAADVVHTEIPFDPANQMKMAAGMIRADDSTLTASIGPDLTRLLDAELQQVNPALDSTPLLSLKTWAVALTLPMLPAQLKHGKALDLVLWDKAVAAGKQTGGIETPEDQLAIFDDLAEPEQVILLGDVLRTLREDRAAGRDSVEDLKTAYLAADLPAIRAELDKSFQALREGEHRELGTRLTARLIEQRDATMAASIHRSLQQDPTLTYFFAAGAGHFSSDTSILSHLAERGYHITAITE